VSILGLVTKGGDNLRGKDPFSGNGNFDREARTRKESCGQTLKKKKNQGGKEKLIQERIRQDVFASSPGCSADELRRERGAQGKGIVVANF